MSIRKIWLIILISVVVASIAISAMLMTLMTDNHFNTYLKDAYEDHIDQIIAYVKESMSSDTSTLAQMAIELETHLDDPISEIRLYDESGNLLLSVDTDQHMMPRSRMMGNFGKRNTGQVESYDVVENGQLIAKLNVVTHTAVENTFEAQAFKNSLWMNSLISMAIALTLSILIGVVISKKMSRALKETAEFAQDLQLGNDTVHRRSNVFEIDQIRKSLEELDTRLRLKQRSRKALVDELIHQTRTPLTILKTHTEALEDGMIDPSDEEMSVFHHQIENLTSIISNVGQMIETEKETIRVHKENIEINALIKKVAAGLRPQFEVKGIQLDLDVPGKMILHTDGFILSQVIYNLFTNALKFSNQGGQVHVSTHLEHNHLKLTVRDNGVGISNDDLPNIFDAYYRGKDALSTKGDGIGLYVVKENLKLLNATIQVDSQVGEGTAFTVDLDLTDFH